MDFFVIVFFVIPPYVLSETIVLLAFSLLLLIRDSFILMKAYTHLESFEAKGNQVIFTNLKGNKSDEIYNEWLPDLDMEIKYFMTFPVMHILKEGKVIFKQYSFGEWSSSAMKEFVNSFYEYKKEQNLWKIYKGQE